jgi:hypothetical protein
MAHLCPVRAYGEWLNASQITNGYVFRKMASGDRISENNVSMVSSAWMSTLCLPSTGPLTCW